MALYTHKLRILKLFRAIWNDHVHKDEESSYTVAKIKIKK